MTPIERREAQWGLFFIRPWRIGFTVFYALPMLASLAFTTMRFQLSEPAATSFIGIQNWSRMLLDDPQVWRS
ncbi:hypothetical protein Q6325_29475, partial [Klebsiella pneumoniae]|nr:hypothetical protein [Klebsiella pneumoniae]